MDMPWSAAAVAAAADVVVVAADDGEPSMKSCFGGLTLQNTQDINTRLEPYCGSEPLGNSNNIWQNCN